MVSDNTATTEMVSSYISQNIRALIRAFRANSRNLSDLFRRLTVEDYVGRRPVIRGMAPEFDELDYVKSIPNLRARHEEVIETGIEPDLVVRALPGLSFQEKVNVGASVNTVADTSETLSLKEARELLDMGAAPCKIDSKVTLPLEVKIDYGVQPNVIIERAMKEKPDLVRQNINRMFEGGLTAEALLEAEIEALDVNRPCRLSIFEWYRGIFDSMVEHAAKGGAALAYEFMELVEDSYYYGDEDDCDDASFEEIDGAFLDMMRPCVKHGLISLDDAVEYLYDIHDRGIVESDLHDKDYVRDMLMS
jgi:hypothetical protein